MSLAYWSNLYYNMSTPYVYGKQANEFEKGLDHIDSRTRTFVLSQYAHPPSPGPYAIKA
jgi:hypothetical protein